MTKEKIAQRAIDSFFNDQDEIDSYKKIVGFLADHIADHINDSRNNTTNANQLLIGK